MDTITIYTPNLGGTQDGFIATQAGPTASHPPTTDQMTPHTRGLRAKRPLPPRSTTTTGNCPAQKRYLTHNPTQHGQITIAGIAYEKVDVSTDTEAHDYVMSLDYLQAPVVYAGPNNHFSGFRPDRIKQLAA